MAVAAQAVTLIDEIGNVVNYIVYMTYDLHG